MAKSLLSGLLDLSLLLIVLKGRNFVSDLVET